MSNPLSINHEKIRKFLSKSIENWQQRLSSSPLGQRLMSGFAWSLTGSMITRILGLVSSVIIARLLGMEGFGELGIINSTMGMLGPFAGFMLGVTATKYISEYRTLDLEKTGQILALTALFAWVTSGIVSIGLFLSSPWIASKVLAAPHLSNGLQISAFIVFFGALNGAQTGALEGFEAFKVIAKLNLIIGISTFFFIILGVYFLGLNGVLWALVGSNFFNWLFTHWALRQIAAESSIFFRFKGCLANWKILWKFSLPSFVSTMISGPIHWGCNALLVNQPNGYAAMGILNVARQWQTPISILCNSLGSIVLPVLSSLNNIKYRKKFKKVFFFNLKITSGLSLLISIPLAIASPLILSWYGPGFVEGVWVFVVIVLSSVLIQLSYVFSQVLYCQEKMWPIVVMKIFWGVTAIAFSYYWIPLLSALGLAGAITIAWVVFLCLLATYVIKLDQRIFEESPKKLIP